METFIEEIKPSVPKRNGFAEREKSTTVAAFGTLRLSPVPSIEDEDTINLIFFQETTDRDVDQSNCF